MTSAGLGEPVKPGLRDVTHGDDRGDNWNLSSMICEARGCAISDFQIQNWQLPGLAEELLVVGSRRSATSKWIYSNADAPEAARTTTSSEPFARPFAASRAGCRTPDSSQFSILSSQLLPLTHPLLVRRRCLASSREARGETGSTAEVPGSAHRSSGSLERGVWQSVHKIFP
jgi:hypothetical protein